MFKKLLITSLYYHTSLCCKASHVWSLARYMKGISTWTVCMCFNFVIVFFIFHSFLSFSAWHCIYDVYLCLYLVYLWLCTCLSCDPQIHHCSQLAYICACVMFLSACVCVCVYMYLCMGEGDSNLAGRCTSKYPASHVLQRLIGQLVLVRVHSIALLISDRVRVSVIAVWCRRQ